MEKKPYVPPRLIAYEPDNVPDRMLFRDVPAPHVTPAYTAILDNNRVYVDVSESFCELVGYKREELIGTRYDHITALNSADIPTTHRLLFRLGYMHGLWMFVHRSGYRILTRDEAWLRHDKKVQLNMEVMRTIL